MYHDMNDGWNWVWTVPLMLLWVAVFGVVVYAAVRLALRHSQQQPPVRQ
jgi:hypothetical protein